MPTRSGDRDQPVPLRRDERRDAAGDQQVDQPSIQRGWYDGKLFQDVLSGRIDRPQPGEHGVHDGRWQIGGVAGRDELGDEERIPGRDRVQVA
jgi:hypothetical protein